MNDKEIRNTCRRIDLIVYCEDIDREYPTATVDSQERYSDDQEYDDRVYLGYRDEDLVDLSESEIHKIQNLYLIQRIGSLSDDMYAKLSPLQREVFDKSVKGYHWFSKDDLPELMKQIKACNKIKTVYFHQRTDDLKDKYGLSDSDLLELLHSVESNDVDIADSWLNVDQFDYGDQVIVFKKQEVALSCGVKLRNLKVRMKLDYSDSHTIVFVSMFTDNKCIRSNSWKYSKIKPRRLWRG